MSNIEYYLTLFSNLSSEPQKVTPPAAAGCWS